jgi:hypothetical protein
MSVREVLRRVVDGVLTVTYRYPYGYVRAKKIRTYQSFLAIEPTDVTKRSEVPD